MTPCPRCGGKRWHFLCGENVICQRCPEGRSLLEEIARENREESKKRAKARSFQRRIAEASSTKWGFNIRVNERQIILLAQMVEEALHDPDNTQAQRSVLFGLRRRVEAAINDTHPALAGRR